jgi:3-phenylpropionate/trans-cinnamate dioxygenase ferredoxin reductase subunit
MVLATGSEPRVIDVPVAATVLTLRTHADSDRIMASFGRGKRLVIVGGGWIGLEVAAAAREAGTDVTLVEASEQPLLGVLGPEMGKVFADLHREHGVDLRLGSTDLGDVEGATVVVGVGVKPRTELAEAAGLDVDNGVLVDRSLRTSDPDIFAVGDIANHDHPVLGRRLRVEHWANALNQPATAAGAILGHAAAYERLPYFFSDQYDLGMEYVGHATRDDTARVVTRGDVEKREFVAFWLDDQDRILAAMNVNVWDVPDEVRPLIINRTVVDVDKLSDPNTPLSDVGL